MLDSTEKEVRKFDEFASSYRNVHAANIGATGEQPEYFAQYKVNCLQRLGVGVTTPILDYGCGIGAVTSQLVRAFDDVHGYDPSQESLVVARQQASAAKFYEDLEAIPKGAFDVVLLSGVLHHVPRIERKGVLKGVRTLLSENGRVVIFEHNPLNPLTRHAVATCPFDDDAVLLWPWELRRELRSAGFDEVAQDYIVFFPRLLAFLRPLEPKLGWLPLGAQTMTVAS